ncbi:MAG: hypothetical protein QOJ71_2237, partial [Actinomycetota bacterium]|nr:hypothetical protein [Actinomycetota bacterium]
MRRWCKASVALALALPGTLGLACSGSNSSSTASAWCGLKLGATREEALAALGAPHGSKASSDVKYPLRPGWSFLEWDEGASIFFALFDATGRAEKLQAYDRVVGPAGAHGLGCQPFRTSSHP